MLSNNLASARRHFAGAIMGLALLGTAGTAGAAPIDLGTVTADPTTGANFSTPIPGGVQYVYILDIPVAPFTIDSGDEVTVHVALSSALTVPAGVQFVGLNFEPRDARVVTSISGTMEFSGGAGAPSGPQPSGFSGIFSNVEFQVGPAFTFTDLVSIAVYNFLLGPVTFEQISLSYQVDSVVAAVPVPAALPLFASGLGVLGFLARRRRKAAA